MEIELGSSAGQLRCVCTVCMQMHIMREPDCGTVVYVSIDNISS